MVTMDTSRANSTGGRLVQAAASGMQVLEAVAQDPRAANELLQRLESERHRHEDESRRLAAEKQALSSYLSNVYGNSGRRGSLQTPDVSFSGGESVGARGGPAVLRTGVRLNDSGSLNQTTGTAASRRPGAGTTSTASIVSALVQPLSSGLARDDLGPPVVHRGNAFSAGQASIGAHTTAVSTPAHSHARQAGGMHALGPGETARSPDVRVGGARAQSVGRDVASVIHGGAGSVTSIDSQPGTPARLAPSAVRASQSLPAPGAVPHGSRTLGLQVERQPMSSSVPTAFTAAYAGVDGSSLDTSKLVSDLAAALQPRQEAMMASLTERLLDRLDSLIAAKVAERLDSSLQHRLDMSLQTSVQRAAATELAGVGTGIENTVKAVIGGSVATAVSAAVSQAVGPSIHDAVHDGLRTVLQGSLQQGITDGVKAGMSQLKGEVTDGVRSGHASLKAEVSDGIRTNMFLLKGELTDGIRSTMGQLRGEVEASVAAAARASVGQVKTELQSTMASVAKAAAAEAVQASTEATREDMAALRAELAQLASAQQQLQASVLQQAAAAKQASVSSAQAVELSLRSLVSEVSCLHAKMDATSSALPTVPLAKTVSSIEKALTGPMFDRVVAIEGCLEELRSAQAELGEAQRQSNSGAAVEVQQQTLQQLQELQTAVAKVSAAQQASSTQLSAIVAAQETAAAQPAPVTAEAVREVVASALQDAGGPVDARLASLDHSVAGVAASVPAMSARLGGLEFHMEASSRLSSQSLDTLGSVLQDSISGIRRELNSSVASLQADVAAAVEAVRADVGLLGQLPGRVTSLQQDVTQLEEASHASTASGQALDSQLQELFGQMDSLRQGVAELKAGFTQSNSARSDTSGVLNSVTQRLDDLRAGQDAAMEAIDGLRIGQEGTIEAIDTILRAVAPEGQAVDFSAMQELLGEVAATVQAMPRDMTNSVRAVVAEQLSGAGLATDKDIVSAVQRLEAAHATPIASIEASTKALSEQLSGLQRQLPGVVTSVQAALDPLRAELSSGLAEAQSAQGTSQMAIVGAVQEAKEALSAAVAALAASTKAAATAELTPSQRWPATQADVSDAISSALQPSVTEITAAIGALTMQVSGLEAGLTSQNASAAVDTATVLQKLALLESIQGSLNDVAGKVTTLAAATPSDDSHGLASHDTLLASMQTLIAGLHSSVDEVRALGTTAVEGIEQVRTLVHEVQGTVTEVSTGVSEVRTVTAESKATIAQVLNQGGQHVEISTEHLALAKDHGTQAQETSTKLFQETQAVRHMLQSLSTLTREYFTEATQYRLTGDVLQSALEDVRQRLEMSQKASAVAVLAGSDGLRSVLDEIRNLAQTTVRDTEDLQDTVHESLGLIRELDGRALQPLLMQARETHAAVLSTSSDVHVLRDSTEEIRGLLEAQEDIRGTAGAFEDMTSHLEQNSEEVKNSLAELRGQVSGIRDQLLGWPMADVMNDVAEVKASVRDVGPMLQPLHASIHAVEGLQASLADTVRGVGAGVDVASGAQREQIQALQASLEGLLAGLVSSLSTVTSAVTSGLPTALSSAVASQTASLTSQLETTREALLKRHDDAGVSMQQLSALVQAVQTDVRARPVPAQATGSTAVDTAATRLQQLLESLQATSEMLTKTSSELDSRVESSSAGMADAVGTQLAGPLSQASSAAAAAAVQQALATALPTAVQAATTAAVQATVPGAIAQSVSASVHAALGSSLPHALSATVPAVLDSTLATALGNTLPAILGGTLPQLMSSSMGSTLSQLLSKAFAEHVASVGDGSAKAVAPGGVPRALAVALYETLATVKEIDATVNAHNNAQPEHPLAHTALVKLMVRRCHENSDLELPNEAMVTTSGATAAGGTAASAAGKSGDKLDSSTILDTSDLLLDASGVARTGDQAQRPSVVDVRAEGQLGSQLSTLSTAFTTFATSQTDHNKRESANLRAISALVTELGARLQVLASRSRDLEGHITAKLDSVNSSVLQAAGASVHSTPVEGRTPERGAAHSSMLSGTPGNGAGAGYSMVSHPHGPTGSSFSGQGMAGTGSTSLSYGAGNAELASSMGLHRLHSAFPAGHMDPRQAVTGQRPFGQVGEAAGLARDRTQSDVTAGSAAVTITSDGVLQRLFTPGQGGTAQAATGMVPSLPLAAGHTAAGGAGAPPRAPYTARSEREGGANASGRRPGAGSRPVGRGLAAFGSPDASQPHSRRGSVVSTAGLSVGGQGATNMSVGGQSSASAWGRRGEDVVGDALEGPLNLFVDQL